MGCNFSGNMTDTPKLKFGMGSYHSGYWVASYKRKGVWCKIGGETYIHA